MTSTAAFILAFAGAYIAFMSAIFHSLKIALSPRQAPAFVVVSAAGANQYERDAVGEWIPFAGNKLKMQESSYDEKVDRFGQDVVKMVQAYGLNPDSDGWRTGAAIPVASGTANKIVVYTPRAGSDLGDLAEAYNNAFAVASAWHRKLSGSEKPTRFGVQVYAEYPGAARAIEFAARRHPYIRAVVAMPAV